MQRAIATARAGMLVVLGAQAQDSPLTLGGGLHYSSGDYGSTITTRITTLEATARYEAGRMVYRASVPYLSVKGDSPALPLENAWSANLGATYKLDTRELTAFWMRRLEQDWRAQLYGLIGLADGSPDWGFGLSLARPF